MTRGMADSSNPPKSAPKSVLVIFGAAGDLTKRLLIPALYNLRAANLLDPDFKVLGVDHNARDDQTFRKNLEEFLQDQAADKDSESAEGRVDKATWDWLGDRLFYQVADFSDDASYRELAVRLEALAGKGASVVFYLAVSSRWFGDIVEQLAKAGLTREDGGSFRRVVIEKPFGSDLASAKALNRRILTYLGESQIYRIDHFLGKETVRNIMVTRFANGVFEPLWSRLHVDHVQISAAETVGVQDRGAFYDKTGALRDMVPNHLFQILAMIAMEPPNSFAPEAVQAETSRGFEAVEVQSPQQALVNGVRGQYCAGEVEGRTVSAYRHEPNVSADSEAETYVALKFTIDNWRWAGVPFYLRTGKALRRRVTEVAIRFKPAPAALFVASGGRPPVCNTLVMRIEPDQGVALHFEAKQPGPDVIPQEVAMDFRYVDYFKVAPATGYETLIYDCLIGDQTLFKRAEDIEFAWRAVQPFLDAWESGGEVHGYPAGSDGPAAADALLARDGRSWRPLTGPGAR